MKFESEMLRLYAVTDRGSNGFDVFYEQVREALEGGATMIQLREKQLDEAAFIEEAKQIKQLTEAFNVPLIINDNVQVCLKSGADGVHVGQSDMEAGQVRALLGCDKIIGVTAKTPEQAQMARAAGADYIGTGAVFGSATKSDTSKISLEQLDQVCEATDLPVVAIGGISCDNIRALKGHKMHGVAVVSALFSSTHIRETAKLLLKLSEEVSVKGGCR